MAQNGEKGKAHKSLLKRLARNYAGYILLPCVLLISLCLTVYYGYFSRQSIRLEEEALLNCCQSIDTAMGEVEGAFGLLQQHRNFLRYLNGYYRTNALMLEICSMELNDLLNRVSDYNRYIRKLRIYPFKGGQIIWINDYFLDVGELENFSLDRDTIYGYWRYDEESGSLVFRKVIRDIAGNTMLGVVELECSLQMVTSPLGTLRNENWKNIYAQAGGRTYRLTEEGFEMCGEPENAARMIRGRVTLADIGIEMEYPGFLQSGYGESRILLATLLATLSAILLLSLGFFMDVRKIVRRISGFSEYIAGSSRLLSPGEYRDDGNDEFSMLVENYNRMLLENQQLATQVELDKLRQDEMAYRILLAQIDPHFIYNALENIHMMAERRDERDISDMSFSLGRLLRYTFSTDTSASTLAAEMDLVEQYLKIQQYRLRSRLTYEIHAPEGMEKVTAPLFVIQPIVENALKHGVVDAEQVIRVEVTVSFGGDGIAVEVKNDGQPPEDALARAINQALEKGERPPGSDTGTGVGLNGVNVRMKRLYPRSFHMRLEPRKEGLSVRMGWDPEENAQKGGDAGEAADR